MRIISGYLRGRYISQPNNHLTRPLKDLTKESIFNILKHSNLIMINLEKSKILDLFSGVGSFGLECISRGAGTTTFIEKNRKCIQHLKQINKLLKTEAKIISTDVFKFIKSSEYKFDLVFADPPYNLEKKHYLLLIENVINNILKNDESIFVLEHYKNFDFKIIEGFFKLKNYGVCSFSFFNQKSG